LKSILLNIFLIFGIFIVFYFSWKPNPNFEESWYMPGWLADWSNQYGQLRTGVPFVFIGMLLAFLDKKNRFLMYTFAMLVLVIIAELGQTFLPHRHFDWMDIVYGVSGGVVGLLMGKVSEHK
jgi:cyanate permease